jgi:tetratricopeptide (TPR) repeat protein
VSFQPLLEVCCRVGTPARLWLVSRQYVEGTNCHAQIGHVEVTGLSPSEALSLLELQGIGSDYQIDARRLCERTNGLPLAVALFATLVRDFNRAPGELLAIPTLTAQKRLRGWYDDIAAQFDEDDISLLLRLSFCEGPFDMNLVRHVCDDTDPDASFNRLQRSYLVQRYSPSWWSVHLLIATFCRESIARADEQAIHLRLAHHYQRGMRASPKLLTRPEMVMATKACRHYQAAGAFEDSGELLKTITPTVKAQGYYATYVQLAEQERNGNPLRDRWVDYHHAHCLFILGRLAEALPAAQSIYRHALTTHDPGLKLTCSRLLAELMIEQGDPGKALEFLREARKIVNERDPRLRVALAHARSKEAWALLRLGCLEESIEVSDGMLHDARAMEKDVSRAVALTHRGIALKLRGLSEAALDDLEEAETLFNDAHDHRGRAWALLHCALIRFANMDEQRACRELEFVLKIRSENGECSREYREILRDLAAYDAIGGELAALLEDESQRVEALWSIRFAAKPDRERA